MTKLEIYEKALKELKRLFDFEIVYECGFDGEYIATVIRYDNDFKFTSHNGGSYIEMALKELGNDK